MKFNLDYFVCSPDQARLNIKNLRLKTIIVVFVVSFLFNYFSLIGYANSNEKYYVKACEFTERISNSLSGFNLWKDATVKFKANLYPPTTDSISAILYDIESKSNGLCGYIIMDYNTLQVLEFSRGLSPYGEYLDIYKAKKFEKIKPTKESLVYTPGGHAIKVKLPNEENEQLLYFTRDIDVSISLSYSKMEIDQSFTPQGTGVHTKIISGVPDYPYTFSCIPTAIGNVLGYWDSHGYPNLMIMPLMDIQEINNRLIDIAGNNTSNSAIPGATQGYCRTPARYPNNFTVTNIWSPSYSQMQIEIDANRPCLVGFASSGPYGV